MFFKKKKPEYMMGSRLNTVKIETIEVERVEPDHVKIETIEVEHVEPNRVKIEII